MVKIILQAVLVAAVVLFIMGGLAWANVERAYTVSPPIVSINTIGFDKLH